MVGVTLTVKLFILMNVFKHSSEFSQFPQIPRSSEFTAVHPYDPLQTHQGVHSSLRLVPTDWGCFS